MKIRASTDVVATQPLLSIREVAAYLNCAEATVRRLTQRGLLPSVRIGQRLRFARADVEAYQAAREAPRPVPEPGDSTAALLTRLQLVTGVFSQLHSPAQAAELVIAQSVRALDASGGMLFLTRGDQAVLIHALGYPPEQLEAWQSIPLERELPLTEAIQRGEPRFFERFPHIPNPLGPLDALASSHPVWALLPLPIDSAVIGAIALSFEQGHSFTTNDRAFLLALAQQCAQAIERARLYEAEHQARLEAETAHARARLLAESAHIFAEARLNLGLLLDRVAAQVAHTMGDNCTIRLLSDDGQYLEPMAVAHPNPEARALLRRLAFGETHRVDEGLTGQVFQSGRPLLISQVDGDVLRRQIKREYWPYLEAFGISSILMVLLQMHGEKIGTLFISRDRPGRPYTVEDQTLLQELADRASTAIENARLYAAEQRARTAAEQAATRASTLQTLTAMLSNPHTPDQIAEIVMTRGIASVGATAAALSLRNEDGSFSIVRMIGYPESVVREWLGRSYSADVSAPIPDAVSRRAPIWLENMIAIRMHYPHLANQLGPHHNGAWATLPLLAEDRAFGGITFVFAQPRPFGSEERGYMQAMAQQCAQAIERARLHAAEQQARAEVEAARQRQTMLAEASVELAASLDVQTTLETLARLVVPHLADWCVIDLLEDDGSIQTAVVTHTDQTKEQLGWDIVRRFPIDPQAPGGTAAVLRTREPELVPAITDGVLAQIARDAEHLRLLRAVGMRSTLCVPLVARGRALGTIALIAAASERSFSRDDIPLLEDLARRAALAVDNARLYRASQQAVQARDTFFSVAAHELKTPLTSLLGQAQLMERRAAREANLSDRSRATLRVIIEQAQRLNAMILAMLDSSRLEQGWLSIERNAVDLVALCRRIAAEVRPTLDRHRIELQTDEAALVVEGDALRLEQVVQNLISNAVKYSPHGGPVRVRLARDGRQACVAVSDEGIGIPAAAQQRLFQRFYRASNVDALHISGMGIGLYVVKEIIGLHGGTVDAESHEGQGSTFTIRLPLAPGQH